MFLSCNLQHSNVPILQPATQQCSYLATHNFAIFYIRSCNVSILELSDVSILEVATQQYSYHATCNLELSDVRNLQLAT